MSVPRKPANHATSARSRPPRLPTREVRRRIWEQACELVADDDNRDIAGVLANRFHTSERVITLCVVSEGMRHERVAATLRIGVLRALESARTVAANSDVSQIA